MTMCKEDRRALEGVVSCGFTRKVPSGLNRQGRDALIYAEHEGVLYDMIGPTATI
jgi:hypothetical protein